MSKKILPLLQQKITFQSVLGFSCLIYGKLEINGNYHILGQVVGDIVELESGNGILWIDKSAYIKGHIFYSNVVLAGKVEGNVTASGTVEVCSGAKIIGDIESDRLYVDSNASINGRLSCLNGNPLN